MIEIFAPKVCFAKELKSSWAANLTTGDGKIPISTLGKDPCLHFEHAEGDWCSGMIPLSKGWDPVDLSDYEKVTFCYYGDRAVGCNVSFRDDKNIQSLCINVSKKTPVEEAVCELSIPLKSFLEPGNKKKGKFQLNNVKFIQFSGAVDDNFYISNLKIQ